MTPTQDTLPGQPHPTLEACQAALYEERGEGWMKSGHRQEGEEVTCRCGRSFVHICDEAEGCSWFPLQVNN